MGQKIDDDDFLITFPDIIRVFSRNKKKIIFGALLCSLLSLWFALSKPISYTAEATFRLKGNSQSGIGKSFTDFLQGGGGAQENEVISLMKSRKLMDKVVQRLHLQAVVTEKGKKTHRLSNHLKNLKTQYAYFKKWQTPIFPENAPCLFCTHIVYKDEISTPLILTFTSEDHYEVKRANGEKLGIGKLGEVFQYPDFSFMLIRNNNQSPLDREIYLTLIPIGSISSNLSAGVKLEPSKTDKNLLTLKYTNADRQFAILFLNELMAVYQNFLKEEHDDAAQMQLAYLEKKKNESFQQQAMLLQDQASDLSDDVSQSGIIDSEKELEFLLEGQQDLIEKIRAIDLEMHRLHYAKNLGDLSKAQELVALSSPSIANTIQLINELKQQSDSLSLALKIGPQADVEKQAQRFSQQMEELQVAISTVEEIQSMIEEIKSDKPISPSSKLLENPKLLIGLWYQRLLDSNEQKQEVQKKKTACLNYLNHLVRIYDVQIKALKERLLHDYDSHPEFQGMDLTSSNILFTQYCTQCSEVEREIRQISFVLEQIKEPNFEVSGLSSVLQDSVSRDIIKKSSDLSLTSHDQNNHSTKELERIKEEILFQKRFLNTHLEQTKELLALREELLKEKIFALQTVILEFLQQKISILQTHVMDFISAQLFSLKQERLLISRTLKDLQKKMSHLPQRHVSEMLVKQNLLMNKTMVEETTKLVEGKNISHHLELIRSAPLDFAQASLLPNSPRLLLFMVIGAFLGAFSTSGFFLLQSIFTGLRASSDNLRQSHQHVSGFISDRCNIRGKSTSLLDTDLATLRRLDSFLSENSSKKGNVALLIIGKGPNYSPLLGELLGIRKQKVILLSLTFNHVEPQEQLPGLLQVLQGESSTPKIIKETYYDQIVGGGISRFATEYIQSIHFKQLLSQLEESYDWIIAVSETLPTHAESEILLNLFDTIAVTVNEEKLLDLAAYTKFAKQSPQEKRVTFLFASS